MTLEDVLNLAVFAALMATVVAIPLYCMRQVTRQTRGTFGRSYANVVTDMMQQNARRSELLVRYLDTRETRIARQERRAEGGR
jgi:hypothetical protein